MDSLALLQFLAGLEEEFCLQIEPDNLNMEFFSDLHALSEYIGKRIQKAPR